MENSAYLALPLFAGLAAGDIPGRKKDKTDDADAEH